MPAKITCSIPARYWTTNMPIDTHHHWTDGLFVMTCKVCGKTFDLFYEAVNHVESHPKPKKEDKNDES